ncbi:hypothetical protein [Alkalihalobacillus hemicellulosilyticus]|uniref:Uncharacterized protein n=1 Tax=Halalkalibacter hemicellulosilyticusJCM 9152 TaxID=1236971 RepID=W4QFY3_9BACI|nr:hypothetical protein [Halalkalibacter hemicellulosilyticus]GAE30558.1 hypothetical protein JCM9152_1968 [Halalkalibacter hemicellulosilyticusJCM 9152]
MIEGTQWDMRIIMLLAVTLLVQSIFLFRDAQKEGATNGFGVFGVASISYADVILFSVC